MRAIGILAIALASSIVACRGAARLAPASDPGFAAAVDSLVPRLLAETGTPGAAVAAIENGRIVLASGYGVANERDGVPFTADTRLNVASISKPVTAWGVLRLVESGAIDLDDPVDRHLSRWSLRSGPFDPAGVTIRRLLNHTAGIGMPSVPGFPTDGAVPSLEDVLAGRTEDDEGVAIERAPGSGWAYSGGGYAVLQLMVEEVSGRDFQAFVRDAILEPIGMRSSSFGPGGRDARGYDEEGASIPPKRFPATAAAGLTTTASDFARLLREYHRAWTGRSSALGASTLRRVADSRVAVDLEGVEGAWYGLGHGVHRRADGSVLLYHTGGNPGFKAWFLVDPVSGDGVFVGVNSDAGVPVIAAVRELWGRVHGSDLPPLF